MRMMEGLGLFFFVFCLFILDDECRDETDQQFFSSRTPTLTQKKVQKDFVLEILSIPNLLL